MQDKKWKSLFFCFYYKAYRFNNLLVAELIRKRSSETSLKTIAASNLAF